MEETLYREQVARVLQDVGCPDKLDFGWQDEGGLVRANKKRMIVCRCASCNIATDTLCCGLQRRISCTATLPLYSRFVHCAAVTGLAGPALAYNNALGGPDACSQHIEHEQLKRGWGGQQEGGKG